MKKLMIAALLVVGFYSFAQDQTQTEKKSKDGQQRERMSPEQRSQAQLDKMTTELNLDAKQQEQIKPIIAEQSVKMEAMRAQQKANREKNSIPSDDEKKEMRKKRMEDREATDNKIKAILTPDQFVKYQAMQEAEKAKMQGQNRPKAGE